MDNLEGRHESADERVVRSLQETLKNAGPDELQELLRLGMSLPADWRGWPPERCLEYLRCRLKFTQDELAKKAGLAQSLVSRIEGGAPALLGTWVKLFKGMGFDLVLLPVSDLPLKAIERKAERGRPAGHWLRQRARPRRRWAAYYAERRRNEEAKSAP